MNTVLTIINEDVNLQSQKILVYLRPQDSSSDWMVSAWQSCAPGSGGGAYTLDAINNSVGAYASFDNDRQKTALKTIPSKTMYDIVQNGNVVNLDNPQSNSPDLTPQQSGVRNTTSVTDIYSVWCLNGRSVCRPQNPMFKTGISAFQLLQKVYFTIGSQSQTETFKVQNWTELQGFDIEADLVSADVIVSIDHTTNEPKFEIANKKYGA